VSPGRDPVAVYVEHPIQDRTGGEMMAITDYAYELLVQKLVA
jgi:hypothetical protein